MFTLAIPWVPEAFLQIVSTAYFILVCISRVGLWSQGTLATFGREKVKP